MNVISAEYPKTETFVLKLWHVSWDKIYVEENLGGKEATFVYDAFMLEAVTVQCFNFIVFIFFLILFYFLI